MIILYLENDDSISNFFFKLFQSCDFQFHHISKLHNFENYLLLNPDIQDKCLIITNALIENKDMFSYTMYVRRKFQLQLPAIAYTNMNIIDNSIRASQAGMEYFFALPVLPYDIINSIHDIQNSIALINKHYFEKSKASPAFHNHASYANKGISAVFKEYLDTYFSAHPDFEPSAGLYDRIMHEIEPQIILSSLKYTNGNRIKAADILGINRNTLRKKMTQYNIDLLNDI